MDKDPGMYSALYRDTPLPLAAMYEVGEIHNIEELNKQLSRIQKSIDSDPELAVGSSKELIETVLKSILEHSAENQFDNHDDLPSLLRKVQREIMLDPASCGGSETGNLIKRTLSNLGQVVIGVGEIRNLVGTGHGRVLNSASINPVHARLVVNAASTITTYLLEVWQGRK